MSQENREDDPPNRLEELDLGVVTMEVAASNTKFGWMKKLATWGVEERGQIFFCCRRGTSNVNVSCLGIVPVPLEARTDEQYSKLCFVWFSSNLTILTFSLGTLGPVVFELGLRDSCLVILLFNVFGAAFPAYLYGPLHGYYDV
ncbi:hypothetical protein CVT26_008274 [Gymnopilus dilepis]|uniref:Uncharacterized protein n=1 Tax=Gymnopilus dilepis TaxID=231916 RepID=A0A409WPF0_9AGAR|nr:hypothetical protein CVT26_008274 [Gymnopilus dilepis]